MDQVVHVVVIFVVVLLLLLFQTKAILYLVQFHILLINDFFLFYEVLTGVSCSNNLLTQYD